jgi:hypothetical protein
MRGAGMQLFRRAGQSRRPPQGGAVTAKPTTENDFPLTQVHSGLRFPLRQPHPTVGACETDFIRKQRGKEAKLVEPILGLTQTESVFDLRIAKALGLTILLLLLPCATAGISYSCASRCGPAMPVTRG